MKNIKINKPSNIKCNLFKFIFRIYYFYTKIIVSNYIFSAFNYFYKCLNIVSNFINIHINFCIWTINFNSTCCINKNKIT